MQLKKSLGQNFLTSPSALAKVIRAAALTAGDTVLEIGPGGGALTKALLATGSRVLAVEKDDRLITPLQTQFNEAIANGKLKLIPGDILQLDLEKLLAREISEKENYQVVANLPYYITGEVLRQLLTARRQPANLTVMLQREVAERLVARDGKESLLSLSVKIFGTPKYVATVPASAFTPRPKVDSAIVRVENISREKFASAAAETKFFQTIRRGFSQKRKQLKNNLALVGSAFAECGVHPTARAEDLILDHWLCLSKFY